MTIGSIAAVVLVSVLAGLGGWWVVRASAAVPSTDPEDDPRYRYQGFVARVTQPIGGESNGRIVLAVDGQRLECDAKWFQASSDVKFGSVDSEVVIERIDGNVAYVEPWELVEGRL